MDSPVPAALFLVSEALVLAWVQVQPSPSRSLLPKEGRNQVRRWAERCWAVGGTVRGGGRGVRVCSEHAPPGSSRLGGSCWSPLAEEAAAVARDSMREPVGKSWQPSVWVAPTVSRGPRLNLPRAPPTSLARILLGPCLGVRGRPRSGLQPGPGPEGGGRSSGARSGEEARLMLAPESASLAWVSPSSRAATRRTLHSRTDSPGSHDALARGTRGGTTGVAAPAPVPARPHHPPGSGWQSAKPLNGMKPPAPPRPDRHSLLAPSPALVTRDPGLCCTRTLLCLAQEAERLLLLLGRKISGGGNFSQRSPAVPWPGLIHALLWSPCPSLRGQPWLDHTTPRLFLSGTV